MLQPPFPGALDLAAAEPHVTAVFVLAAGLLVAVSVLFGKAAEGAPILLLFLLSRMLGGSEGIGGVAFED